MSYVIVKATTGYIVHPQFYHVSRGECSEVSTWAAFDTWEQAAAWIGQKFKEGYAP